MSTSRKRLTASYEPKRRSVELPSIVRKPVPPGLLSSSSASSTLHDNLQSINFQIALVTASAEDATSNSDPIPSVTRRSRAHKTARSIEHASPRISSVMGPGPKSQLTKWFRCFQDQLQGHHSRVIGAQLLLQRVLSLCQEQQLGTPNIYTTATAFVLLTYCKPLFHEGYGELVEGILTECSVGTHVIPSRAAGYTVAVEPYARASYFESFREASALYQMHLTTQQTHQALIALEGRVVAGTVGRYQFTIMRNAFCGWRGAVRKLRRRRQELRSYFAIEERRRVIPRVLFQWRHHARKVIADDEARNSAEQRRLTVLQTLYGELQELKGAHQHLEIETSRRASQLEMLATDVSRFAEQLATLAKKADRAQILYTHLVTLWCSVMEAVFGDAHEVLSSMKSQRDETLSPPTTSSSSGGGAQKNGGGGASSPTRRSMIFDSVKTQMRPQDESSNIADTASAFRKRAVAKNPKVTSMTLLAFVHRFAPLDVAEHLPTAAQLKHVLLDEQAEYATVAMRQCLNPVYDSPLRWVDVINGEVLRLDLANQILMEVFVGGHCGTFLLRLPPAAESSPADDSMTSDGSVVFDSPITSPRGNSKHRSLRNEDRNAVALRQYIQQRRYNHQGEGLPSSESPWVAPDRRHSITKMQFAVAPGRVPFKSALSNSKFLTAAGSEEGNRSSSEDRVITEGRVMVEDVQRGTEMLFPCSAIQSATRRSFSSVAQDGESSHMHRDAQRLMDMFALFPQGAMPWRILRSGFKGLLPTNGKSLLSAAVFLSQEGAAAGVTSSIELLEYARRVADQAVRSVPSVFTHLESGFDLTPVDRLFVSSALPDVRHVVLQAQRDNVRRLFRSVSVIGDTVRPPAPVVVDSVALSESSDSQLDKTTVLSKSMRRRSSLSRYSFGVTVNDQPLLETAPVSKLRLDRAKTVSLLCRAVLYEPARSQFSPKGSGGGAATAFVAPAEALTEEVTGSAFDLIVQQRGIGDDVAFHVLLLFAAHYYVVDPYQPASVKLSRLVSAAVAVSGTD